MFGPICFCVHSLNEFVFDEGMNANVDDEDYDIMISVICLFVIIALVTLIFGYWCYWYPKQQMKRNDAFWLGHISGQNIVQSAASDNERYHE